MPIERSGPSKDVSLPDGERCPLCRGGVNEFGHTRPCYAVQNVVEAAARMIDANDGHRCSSGNACAVCALRDSLEQLLSICAKGIIENEKKSSRRR